MDKDAFSEKLRQNPRPVVVDFWAPWCGPCKMIKPVLEKLAQDYSGRVDLWQINADDNPGLVQALGVYGIPTLIVYQGDKEMLRYVGAKPASVLQSLFETLASGDVPVPAGLSGGERFIRFGAGLAVAGAGAAAGFNWFLLILGGVLMFSAIYDRCPIWRAITAQFKKLTARA